MPFYDFSQDFYPTYPVQLPASNFDDEEDMSDAGINDHPTSLIPTYVYGPDKSHPIAQIPKTTRSPTLDGALRLSISKNGKAKNRPLNPNHTPTSRRREKAYRCPVMIVYSITTVFLTWLLYVPTDATMYESKFFLLCSLPLDIDHHSCSLTSIRMG
jgi:hypothetical protein